MIYLKNIEVLDTNSFAGSEVLKKGFSFKCSDINLFVGDQGTGKSTLLKMIQENHSALKITLDKKVSEEGINSYYFDTEKNNPRMNNPELYTDAGGHNVGIGFGGALASRFKSHGEILRDMVVEPLFNAKDCIILIDEPESGMSLKSQFRLVEGINTALKNNCQIFLATHCLLLIEHFDVVSLDEFKVMSGKEYINKCM